MPTRTMTSTNEQEKTPSFTSYRTWVGNPQPQKREARSIFQCVTLLHNKTSFRLVEWGTEIKKLNYKHKIVNTQNLTRYMKMLIDINMREK